MENLTPASVKESLLEQQKNVLERLKELEIEQANLQSLALQLQGGLSVCQSLLEGEESSEEVSE